VIWEENGPNTVVIFSDPTQVHKELAGEFTSMAAQYNMSHGAGTAVWSWALKNSKRLKIANYSTKGTSYRTLRRMAEKRGPKLIVKCTHLNRQTGSTEVFEGPCFPSKKYKDRNKWQILIQSCEARVKDIKKLHIARHVHASDASKTACQTKLASFSVDGVPESKQHSVDILSLIFEGCRTVYSVKVIKKEKAFKKYTPNFILDDFIVQCRQQDIQVP
jgi:hypothetical protein